ncbi:hypothetical protein ACHAW6_005494 [Cyclotella cf. meneghiniana]
MTSNTSENSPELQRSPDETVNESSSLCDSPIESCGANDVHVDAVDVNDDGIASQEQGAKISDDANEAMKDSTTHSAQFEISTHHTGQDDDDDDDDDDATLPTTPTIFPTADRRHQTTLSSTKKFVHFLSDVEGTPIQTAAAKTFVEDDSFFKSSFELEAPRFHQEKHSTPAAFIQEDAEDDEKKEEAHSLLLSNHALVNADATQVVQPTTTAHVSSPTRTSATHATYDPSAPTSNSSHPSRISYVSPPGRRTITLRLQEEIHDAIDDNNNNTNNNHASQLTPFRRLSSLRRFRSLSLSTVMLPLDEKGKVHLDTHDLPANTNVSKVHNAHEPFTRDQGVITVSWYEGTTSAEMQQHVYNCVLRKLKANSVGEAGGNNKKLEDVRLLDENVVPHQEVVLCPFLPDGSHFLLKFKTSTPQPPHKQSIPDPYNVHHHRIPPYISRAPDSPSAEPSPYPSSANLSGINAQLQLLNAATALLQSNAIKAQPLHSNGMAFDGGVENGQRHHGLGNVLPKIPMLPNVETVPRNFMEHQTTVGMIEKDATAHGVSAQDEASFSPESTENTDAKPFNINSNNNATDAAIEQQLRKLNELFLLRNGSSLATNSSGPQNERIQPSDEDDHDPYIKYYKSQEKKQVIFTIANYFVLFMGIIAASAEIQSRLPQWMNWVQENYDSVQNCATDSDALMECILNGNFSGLVASFMLWATQSAAAKRIFLFGFDTPKKLWTVVYEALVTAVCWGLSYLFIRRGLNPNTREKFIQKYWKDAVYGSLAGFNAAFMKAVLKNLVPQDVALQAIETRQLKLFNWLGMLLSDE